MAAVQAQHQFMKQNTEYQTERPLMRQQQVWTITDPAVTVPIKTKDCHLSKPKAMLGAQLPLIYISGHNDQSSKQLLPEEPQITANQP